MAPQSNVDRARQAQARWRARHRDQKAVDGRKRYQRLRAWVLSITRPLLTACVRCGATERLHFHHRDPATKRFNISGPLYIPSPRYEHLIAEIAKCEVLCESCHGAHHAERRWHG